MRKTGFALLVAALLFLCACADSVPAPEREDPLDTPVQDLEKRPEGLSKDPSVQAPEQPSKEDVVSYPEQNGAEPESKPLPEEETIDGTSELPYLQKNLYGALQVFEGPGYDYGYAMTADIGTYTIIAEVMDEEGNLWGQLKSGVGWVDLTKLWADNKAPGPVSIGLAQSAPEGEHHACIVDDSPYTQYILIRANEPLSQLRFSVLEYEEESFAPAKVHCELAKFSPEKPLFMGVVFYGDMTAYGVSFVNSSGEAHNYALSISGRNGSLVVQEYTAS